MSGMVVFAAMVAGGHSIEIPAGIALFFPGAGA
jgi:hypothetical protein